MRYVSLLLLAACSSAPDRPSVSEAEAVRIASDYARDEARHGLDLDNATVSDGGGVWIVRFPRMASTPRYDTVEVDKRSGAASHR
jgi:hypothetical protein